MLMLCGKQNGQFPIHLIGCRELTYEFAVFVDQECFGQRDDVIVFPYRGIILCEGAQVYPRRLVAFKCGDPVAFVKIHGNRYDLEPHAVVIFIIQVLDLRYGFNARSTPGSPEIQQNDPATVVLQPVDRTVTVL